MAKKLKQPEVKPEIQKDVAETRLEVEFKGQMLLGEVKEVNGIKVVDISLDGQTFRGQLKDKSVLF